MNWGRSSFALALVVGTMALIPAAASAQTQTLTTCPVQYQVPRDDTIGKLKLSAGSYFITVLNPANLSCAKAAQNLGEFLLDFDGVLRRPWIYDTSTQTFVRGKGSPIGFFVSRAGPASAGGTGCPGTFSVLHNDHIGRLTVNRGPYRITVLNPKSLTCSQASRNLSEFLQDYNGVLRRPWIIASLTTATFTRGRGSTIGFRIKPATKRSSGGGSGTVGGECPGTFRVLNTTRIGSVTFRRGPYLTFPQRGSGLSCQRANAMFTQFLNRDFSGLPRPWTLNGRTGTFTNGSRPGFRVKPTN